MLFKALVLMSIVAAGQTETGEIIRDYKLYDSQLMALELAKSHQIVSVAGSVQNGKSIGALVNLTLYMQQRNPSPDAEVERAVWITIPDRAKYWEALKPKIELIFGRADHGGLILDSNMSKPSYTLRAADGGKPWECFVKSLKDPDTARSATICAAMMSEAGICEEQAYDNLLGRLAMRNGPLFIESSPFGLNWYWKRVVNNASRTVVYRNGVPEFFTNPHGDSRIASIYGVKIEDNLAMDRAQIAALRAGTSNENAKREFDGEFFQWSGLVWKRFKPVPYEMGGHLVPPPKPSDFDRDGKYGQGWYVFSGMDFGFDHPFAHVWIARKGNKRIVLDEYSCGGETLKTHAGHIHESPWNKYSEYRYRDPSGAQAGKDLQEFGVDSDEAVNDVEPGLDCVARLFEQRELLVSSSCRQLIDAIGNYHRDERTQRPVKVVDDLPDALRYGVYTDDLKGGPALPHYSSDLAGRMSVQTDDDERLAAAKEMLDESQLEEDAADKGKEVV